MSRPDSVRKSLPGIGRFFARFRPILRAERAVILTGLAALLGQTIVRLLEPWPLKFVIDEIIKPDQSAELTVPIFGAVDTHVVLITCAVALVVITSLRSGLGYLSKVNFALAGNRTVTRIRAKVFGHLQILPLDFHYRERGGDLVTRLVGDVGMIKEVTVNAIMPLVASVLVLFGMLTVMLWLNVQLTIIIVCLIPALWFVTAQRSQKIGQVARKNRRREGAIAATVSESLTAIKTVQTLSVDSRFSEQFSSHNDASMKQGARVAKMSAGLERSVDLMIALGSAFALWYGARQVLNATLTPGELLVFLFYMKRGFRPMRDYAKYSARLGKASAAAERVVEVLDQLPAVKDDELRRSAPDFRGDIEFRNVSYHYPDGSAGLSSASFKIQAGETVMIVGPSGGGKSTLLNLLIRLHEPKAGNILVDGQDINMFSTESYRSQFNVVIQDGLLFTASVRDNIALLHDDATDAEVVRAASIASADGFIRSLPHAYDTEVGERGVSLSQGQRQRIAIARAAIRKRPIMLLDEPTTGLDAATEAQVSAAIETLSVDTTTLWVTHKPPHGVSIDRVLVVNNGVVSELHDIGSVFASDARLRKIVTAYDENVAQMGAVR